MSLLQPRLLAGISSGLVLGHCQLRLLKAKAFCRRLCAVLASASWPARRRRGAPAVTG
jgi:hypothetical protein